MNKLFIKKKTFKSKVKKIKATLHSDDLRASKRILGIFASENKSKLQAVSILEKLAQKNLASSAKEIRFFIIMLKAMKMNQGYVQFLEKFGKRLIKNIKVKSRPTKFPSYERFDASLRSLFSKGKYVKGLFLAVVLASGRRGVEIQRLKGADIIEKKPGVFLARLEWSKKSVKPSFFVIDLDSVKPWLDKSLDLNQAKSLIRSQIGNSRNIFPKNIHKNLNRELSNFTLHALRTVKCIFMLREGLCEEEVMRQLGWQDKRMFLRYLRAEPDLLKNCANVNDALAWVEIFEK